MFTQTHTQYRQCLSSLELNEGATFDDVKAAYRSLAKRWHPDRFARSPGERENAEERMKRINEAYTWLADNRYLFDIDWTEESDGWEEHCEETATCVREQEVQPQAKKEGLGCGWGIGVYLIVRAIGTAAEDGDYGLVVFLVLIVVVMLVLFSKPSAKNQQSSFF